MKGTVVPPSDQIDEIGRLPITRLKVPSIWAT
jgi:hypothetical protein